TPVASATVDSTTHKELVDKRRPIGILLHASRIMCSGQRSNTSTHRIRSAWARDIFSAREHKALDAAVFQCTLLTPPYPSEALRRDDLMKLSKRCALFSISMLFVVCFAASSFGQAKDPEEIGRA